MCGCSNTIGNCNCECNFELPSIAGPQGPPGDPGVTILYTLLGTTLSTGNINVDTLMPTSSTTLMPTGTRLPANTLDVNGEYLMIEIEGTLNQDVSTQKQIKIGFGSPLVTVLNIPASIISEQFKCLVKIQRRNNTQVTVDSICYYNSINTILSSKSTTLVDLSNSVDIGFYINHGIEYAVTIEDITISKYNK